MKKRTMIGFAAVALIVLFFLFTSNHTDPSLSGTEKSVTIHPDSVKILKKVPASTTAEMSVAPAHDVWSREQLQGDYQKMVERRKIRVLMPPSKTFFFLDKGHKRGLSYDNMMDFEKYINRQLKSKHIKVKLIVIPTSRKHLIPDLMNGYGDIAVGNLTITPSREMQVAFTNPMLTGVNEIIVTHKNGPELHSIFDLAGMEIFVRESSSYYDSLVKLNETLLSLGKEKVKLTLVDEYLEDEDLLEMINADLLSMIVIDSHKGAFWEKVFTNIRLYPELKLRMNSSIGMAVRKDCPELLKVLNGYVAKNKKGTLIGNILYRRYLENTKYVKNNQTDKAQKQFSKSIVLFKKYGRQFDFPYLFLTALAFQESGLDNTKKSHAGAVGIMQVLPRIRRIENNIHAGTKYLYFLKSRYFSDPGLDPLNADLFTIAAYNAGPARIARLRKSAASKGLDPNVWFNNVEVIASIQIGRETVQYVANIYKYYVVYKYIVKQQQVREIGKDLMESHYGR